MRSMSSATVDERLVRVVDLKFFCGFSFVEIAEMMGVSERTIQRDWEKARIFLYRRLDPTRASRLAIHRRHPAAG